MAITLATVAKLETEPLKKYVLMNLLRWVSIMEYLPFENVDSLRVIATRWRTLPSVSFRRINEGYSHSEGDVEQVWETLFGLGGEFHYDRVFEKVKNFIVDPMRVQTDMKTKALAFQFNDYFINGDHATDEDGFEGLKKRVANMPSRQSVYFAASNAAALDPTASVANARAYLDKVEEVHYKTNAGQHNLWMMNEGMKWGVGRALRYLQTSGANILDTTKDSFERTVTTLYGSPMVDVGPKADQSTEIITDSEVAGDSGTDATSIYCVSFGIDEGITGIQLSPVEVYDPQNGGEMESLPVKMIRMDWWVGLAGFGSYGVTRGRNVEGASNWT